MLHRSIHIWAFVSCRQMVGGAEAQMSRYTRVPARWSCCLLHYFGWWNLLKLQMFVFIPEIPLTGVFNISHTAAWKRQVKFVLLPRLCWPRWVFGIGGEPKNSAQTFRTSAAGKLEKISWSSKLSLGNKPSTRLGRSNLSGLPLVILVPLCCR